MTLLPYRETLALPGIRSLLLVTLFARIPTTASTVTLTLHVVQDQHRGYGAAGLVGAVIQDPVRDTVAFKEYLETVVRERAGWRDLYRAARDLV